MPSYDGLKAWVEGFRKNMSAGHTDMIQDKELRRFLFPHSKLGMESEEEVPIKNPSLPPQHTVPSNPDVEMHPVEEDKETEEEIENRLLGSDHEEYVASGPGVQSEQPSGCSTPSPATLTVDAIAAAMEHKFEAMVSKIIDSKLPKGMVSAKDYDVPYDPSKRAYTPDDDDDLDVDEVMSRLPQDLNPWRPCDTCVINPAEQVMILPSGQKINISDIRIANHEAWPNTFWRYKDQYLDSVGKGKNKPPKQETIVYAKDKVEKTIYDVALMVEGRYATKGALANSTSAMEVDPSYAPAAKKVLLMQREEMTQFILNDKKVTLKEAQPCRQFFLGLGDEELSKLISAFGGKIFPKDAAKTQTRDSLFGQLSADACDIEKKARCEFMDLVSAISLSETFGKNFDANTAPYMEAVSKKLVKPLFEAHYRWVKAKANLRKEAMAFMSSTKPHYNRLLTSEMWSEELFCPKALEEAMKDANQKNLALATLLGYTYRISKVQQGKKKNTSPSYYGSPVDNRHQPYPKKQPFWVGKKGKGRRNFSGGQGSNPQPQQHQQHQQQKHQQNQQATSTPPHRGKGRGRGGFRGSKSQ